MRSWFLLLLAAGLASCERGAGNAEAQAPPRAGAPSAATAEASVSPRLAGVCADSPALRIVGSPRAPFAGAPLRILIAAETAAPAAAVHVLLPDGRERIVEATGWGGPPFGWHAELSGLLAGRHRVGLVSADGSVLACREFAVASAPAPPSARTNVVWPVERDWDRDMENVYGAWLGKLFFAPPTERPEWKPLHQVLRDRERNFLYDSLGLGEDDDLVVEPDCADTPQFLRAYFAWKMRLPFVYAQCSSGSSTVPPRCDRRRSNLDPPRAPSEAVAFRKFLKLDVANTVHSAGGRTMPRDNSGDLYPLSLSREALRPGTVFVDPYGHLLILSQWIDQTPDASGVLFAINGEPDLSVGRKRFWRGAFLFNVDLGGGAGGFKAFRPVVMRDGVPHVLTNDEIRRHRGYANYSDEQYVRTLDEYYDRVERVLNPVPVPPDRALRDRVVALHDLVIERVGSVRSGEEYMAKNRNAVVAMPEGPVIFETQGPWEDYSTPARDLRLGIAMAEVLGFPDKVARQPSFFAMPAGRAAGEVARGLRSQLDGLFEERTMEYARSDGSTQRLTLAEVVRRRVALEMAYNPNDCVEIRWGARPDSEEYRTCRRHAPAEQLARMAQYRPWFHERRRPARP